MAVSNIDTFQPATVNLDPTPQIKLPVSAWMTSFGVADIPADSVPWMLAQGWKIESVDYDDSTAPPTAYYNMSKQGMFEAAMLQSLVNTYTNAYNEGRNMNAFRYNNIVTNWSLLIGKCITQLDSMAANSNAYVSVYLSELGTLMDAVDAQIAAANATTTGMIDRATGLGTTDLARINEHFANSLAAELQKITERGFYSSAMVTDITARNTRELNEAIAAHNDKINREKIDIDKFSVQARHQTIAQQLQANMARLSGRTQLHAQEMELYKYMTDTRNNIVIGLFGFEERRTDVVPSLEIMAQLCSQLGNSGSTSWVTP